VYGHADVGVDIVAKDSEKFVSGVRRFFGDTVESGTEIAARGTPLAHSGRGCPTGRIDDRQGEIVLG
jgi:hypothetical protein